MNAEERAAMLAANPGLQAMLLETVGLRNADPADPLHAQLIDALIDAGPGATLGQRIVALRYVFNWELLEAGRVYAKAKTDYEAQLTEQKVIQLAKDKMSVAKAEILADGSEGAYELKLRYLLAEQRERAMRNFLGTLDKALDNHRTDRADQRAGDAAHAQGYTGGA